MQKRAHIFFTGRVQGVGFRYTVRSVAVQFDALGWVKNLNDGSVEVVAEKDEDTLKDFIADIEKQFKGYINDIQVKWEPAKGEFKEFSVKF